MIGSHEDYSWLIAWLMVVNYYFLSMRYVCGYEFNNVILPTYNETSSRSLLRVLETSSRSLLGVLGASFQSLLGVFGPSSRSLLRVLGAVLEVYSESSESLKPVPEAYSES